MYPHFTKPRGEPSNAFSRGFAHTRQGGHHPETIQRKHLPPVLIRKHAAHPVPQEESHSLTKCRKGHPPAAAVKKWEKKHKKTI